MTNPDEVTLVSTEQPVLAEMRRIRVICTPSDGSGDREDLITYAKEIVTLRASATPLVKMREALSMACKMLDEGGFAYPAEWVDLSSNLEVSTLMRPAHD